MVTTLEKEILRYTALDDKERFKQIIDGLVSNDIDNVSKARRSINNYLFAPYHLKNKLGAKSFADIQNFATKGSFPELNTLIYSVFNTTPNFDDRYVYSYRETEFDDGRDYFELLDVTNGIRFERLPEGAKVKISSVSGNVAIVKASTYAAGLGWTFEMIEDRKYGLMKEIAIHFRNSWFNALARIHYSLLVDQGYNANNANGGAPVPYSLPATDPEPLRILKTINNAASLIGNALRNTDILPDPAIAPVNVYVHPSQYQRVFDAVKPTAGFNQQTYANVVRQINVYSTFQLIRTDGTAMNQNEALIVVPGGKNVTAMKLPPTEYTRVDIESFSQIMTVRARIGVIAGEPRQILRATIA